MARITRRVDGVERGWLPALGASGVLVLAVVATGALAGGLLLFNDFPVDLTEPDDEVVQVGPSAEGLGEVGGFGSAGAATARSTLRAVASSLAAAGASTGAGGGPSDTARANLDAGTGPGGGTGSGVQNGGTPGSGNGGGAGQGQTPGAGGGQPPGAGTGSPADSGEEPSGALNDTLRNLAATVAALRDGDGADTLGGVTDTLGNGAVRDVGDILSGTEQPGGN